MTLTVTRAPLYAFTAVVFASNLLLLAFTRASFDTSSLPAFLGFTLFLAMGFVTLSRRAADPAAQSGAQSKTLPLLRNLFEGLLFLQLTWLNLRLLNHLTMMLPVPFWDDTLIRWDQALGFDWLAYFDWVHARPALITLLDYSYTSLTALSVVALLGLILMGQPTRARYFCDIFFVTAVICIVAGAFFPALAAVHTQVADLSAYPNFPFAPGVYHLQHLDALRDPSAEVVLRAGALPGLVTFPSFHTSGGILLCCAYARTWLFVPVLGYAAVMIASTPVFGGHYFIDLIAGSAVALAVAAYYAQKPAYRSLFAPKQQTAPLASASNLG